jgi:hypothetical protein
MPPLPKARSMSPGAAGVESVEFKSKNRSVKAAKAKVVFFRREIFNGKYKSIESFSLQKPGLFLNQKPLAGKA